MPVRNRNHAAHAQRVHSEELTMEKIYGKSATFRLLSMLIVGVLFGSVATRADVVSDWNTIAVNTAVANKQNPFAQAR
ncbi:MAG TPA: hypothetical protein VHQ22_10740, partial [Terriglobales bacterium]|nr:hypothetical protein [Terriglobales bacterium]